MADWVQSLQRACGVARIARVTGLDRAGVEVACAIRPGGHVLQVCNGKGETWQRAREGALCEAAELWAAENVHEVVQGTRREVDGWDPRELDPHADPQLLGPDVRLSWRRGRDLHDGRDVHVPAAAVHCPPATGPLLGPAAIRWSSNGMGAHPRADAALLHALLEAVERDGLARALPGGWTRAAVKSRKVQSRLPLVRQLREVGLTAHLFDLRPTKSWCGLPLAGAILVDEQGGPTPLTAGYACRLRAEDALHAALLEAAQSRLTDVHGAREDVAAPDPHAAAALAKACAAAPARNVSLPDVKTSSDAAGVLEVVQRLHRAGYRRAAMVSLAPQDFPVAIVKVLVPGLLVSELL